jgi:hypothetical protein
MSAGAEVALRLNPPVDKGDKGDGSIIPASRRRKSWENRTVPISLRHRIDHLLRDHGAFFCLRKLEQIMEAGKR